MNYKEYFTGKKITVMGLGLLGRGVGDAKFLAEQGAEVTVTDLKTEHELRESVDQLRDFDNVRFVLGEHRQEDFINADLILKSAGVRIDDPYIQLAKRAGVAVKMSTSLFAELSPAAIVGVTGTRGKTTVTHLVAHILKTADRNVFVGGNVRGVSTLAHVPDSHAGEIAVLELDSWQLQGFGEAGISPHVAVFTTFMRDHMNYYAADPADVESVERGMEIYLADKANIFLFQEEGDHLVISKQVESVVRDTYEAVIRSTVHVVESDLEMGNVNLIGEHNCLNIALASQVARILGIPEDVVRVGVGTFKGVPGRLEYIRTIGGVSFYNDTTATTPDATRAGLRALGKEKKVVLIMGGASKMLDMNNLLGDIEQYCVSIVLLPGTGTDGIASALYEKNIVIKEVANMQEAVECSFAQARNEGNVVLLSPAFASFGLFKNEFDRGDQFCDAVQGLEE